MENVSYKNVELTGGFWGGKQRLNEEVTIRAVWDRFYETGRVEAFDCRWREGDPVKPHVFWDSDVAKWIEGASYIIAKHDRPDLVEKIEHVIDMIEKNAWEDGYINSHFTVVDPGARFTKRHSHELYCLGHLCEAAVAYFEATGRDRFLKLVCKYADLVDRVFRVEGSAVFSTPGHEELELALFRLAETTGEEKYARLAEFFLETRGNNDKDRPEIPAYQQDFPIREQTEAMGHAVRAVYLYSGMADLARRNGDEKLKETCRAVFRDIVTKKMYVTGGLGSFSAKESFTEPYDLPNEHAYAETCAGIGMIFFCERLLREEARGEYADVIEKILYNGFISGLSLSGDSFFYENPLEINRVNHLRLKTSSRAEHYPITERVKVFDCSCCPPNVNRLLASLGGYIYSVDGDTLIVEQYMSSRGEVGGMKFEIRTDYPHDGKIEVTTEGVGVLKLRLPGWCKSFSVSAEYRLENGYIVIDKPSDRVELVLDMPVVMLYANAGVYADAGRVAISRGPVVYCAEGRDNGTQNLNSIVVRGVGDAVLEDVPEYGGVPALRLSAERELVGESLYSTEPPRREEFELRMIPYFAFANRGSDNMLVWLRKE